MRPVVYILLLFSSYSVAQNNYQKAQSLFNDDEFEQADLSKPGAEARRREYRFATGEVV